MTCDRQHLDGSYVLGALAPVERQDYERHLATCADCSRAVAELAGLPGLLGRVDPSVFDEVDLSEDRVPATLLPALVQEVRRSSRHRRWATAGLAAAAAVLVVIGSLTAVGVLGGGDDDAGVAAPPPAPTDTRSMSQLEPGPVTATVAFTDVAWGTRLDLVCTYARLLYAVGADRTTSYALVVRTRDGRTEQVATWRALPGRTMVLEAATAARRADIVAVEVRTAAGEPVLRLDS